MSMDYEPWDVHRQGRCHCHGQGWGSNLTYIQLSGNRLTGRPSDPVLNKGTLMCVDVALQSSMAVHEMCKKLGVWLVGWPRYC